MIEYDGKEVEYELKKSSEIPDEILPTVGEYMDAEEGEYEYKRICQNWRR